MSEPVIIGKATLYLGDCVETMKAMPDNSIDAIVSDPPYLLSFMGKAFDAQHKALPGDNEGQQMQAWHSAWVKEAYRVLKPGGYCAAAGGTRTYHRLSSALEDCGFEIRDCIMWCYGSGFPKSRNIGKEIKEYEGWGTALKPSYEPFVVVRKPLSESTVAENVLKHGTGAINIDDCRVSVNDGSNRSRDNSRCDPDKFWNGKKRINQVIPENLGRWPSNLCLDGSEAVMGMFPEMNGELHNKLSSGNSMFLPDNNGSKRGFSVKDSGSAARFFHHLGYGEHDFPPIIYCPKAAKSDRDSGCEGMEYKELNAYGDFAGTPEHPKKIGVIARNNHPTTKPVKLMQHLLRLLVPPGGVALDPFMGSGSTLKAACLEGMACIGIEMDEEYFKIAEARVRHSERQQVMF